MLKRLNPFAKMSKDKLFDLVISNDPDAVHRLLTNSSLNVDTLDSGGFTPLMYAVNHGYNDMVRTLLFHNADANAVHEPSGWFPLLFAVDMGNNAALDYLLMVEEIDVNKARQVDGQTALHQAASKGNTGAVTKLIEHGADANAITRQHYTPLAIAIINQKPFVIKRLLSIPDVDINSKNGGGETPLMLAIKYHQPEIVELLLSKRGIDVNDKDDDGYTALHYTVANNDAESARKLIAAGADINAINNDGFTPFALLADVNDDTTRIKSVLQAAMQSAANRSAEKMKLKKEGGRRRTKRRKAKRNTRRHA